MMVHMDEINTIAEPLQLNANPDTLVQWLKGYFMNLHPSDQPSVWHTYMPEGIVISYHAPPDGRISLLAEMTASETMTIRRVSYRPSWESYTQRLIESIQQRWATSQTMFDFESLVKDKTLAGLLRSRLEESRKTRQAGAYLSTIVLLGSILEGVLLEKVMQNPQVAGNANSAPKERDKTLSFDKWTLDSLIAVAHECGWLDRETHSYAIVLREYRNLIHPREQIKRSLYPDADTCDMSEIVVRTALADLKRAKPAA
jgi:hypothetical protein